MFTTMAQKAHWWFARENKSAREKTSAREEYIVRARTFCVREKMSSVRGRNKLFVEENFGSCARNFETVCGNKYRV